MNPAQRLLWLGGMAALLGASPSMANKVTELSVHKPSDLEIKVASTNGVAWDKVVSTGPLKFYLKADCRFDKKFGFQEHGLNELHFTNHGLSLELDSPFLRSKGGSKKKYWVTTPFRKRVVFKTGFIKPVPGYLADPIKACNKELQNRVFTHPNTPREKFLAEGFDVTVVNGGKVNVFLQCNPKGGGFTDFHDQDETYNLKVRCLPSEAAKKKLNPPPKQAKFIPPATVKQAKVFVNHAFYRGQCPVMLRYKGQIVSSGKGKFKYQFVHSDGTKTQLQTLAFPGAGRLETKPQIRSIYAKKASKNLAIGPQQGVRYDFDGWIRLKVIDPLGKVHWSPKQKVRVDCSKTKAGKPLKTAPKPPPQPPHQGSLRQAPKPAGMRLAPAPQ